MNKKFTLLFLFGFLSNNVFLAESFSEEVELFDDGNNTYGHYEKDEDDQTTEEEDFEIPDEDEDNSYEDED